MEYVTYQILKAPAERRLSPTVGPPDPSAERFGQALKYVHSGGARELRMQTDSRLGDSASASKRQVLHRDLKPANVLLNSTRPQDAACQKFLPVSLAWEQDRSGTATCVFATLACF